MMRCTFFRLCAAAAATAPASGTNGMQFAAYNPSELAVKQNRVVAWYQARPLDLTSICARLLQRGATVHCTYPPLPAASTTAGNKKKKSSPLATKGELEVICFTGPSGAQAAEGDSKQDCPTNPITYVVFGEGSIVGWNADWEEMVKARTLLEELGGKHLDLSQRPLSAPPSELEDTSLAVDSMTFKYFDELTMEEQAGEQASNYVDTDSDVLVLASPKVGNLMPFSCAMAQSVKLDAMNSAMNPLAEQVKAWQRHLAAHGELRCTVKQLRKSKTHLLSLIEYLNFRYNAQTTPKIFWSGEFQPMRSVYREACDHFEMEERHEALKSKMEAADESLSYLHDEVHASSNELLTWVIIWLIFFEVCLALGVFQLAFKILEPLFTPAKDTEEDAKKKKEYAE